MDRMRDSKKISRINDDSRVQALATERMGALFNEKGKHSGRKGKDGNGRNGKQ